MVVQAAGRDAIEAADLTAAADEGVAATQRAGCRKTRILKVSPYGAAGGVGPGQGLRPQESIAGRVGHDLDEDFFDCDNLLHLFPDRSRSPGHKQAGIPIHGLPLSLTKRDTAIATSC